MSIVSAARDCAPEMYAESAARFAVVHLLASQRRLPHGIDRSPDKLSERRLNRVLEYMAAHFAEPLSLAHLAREGSVSRFHFVQLFRKASGMTPHRYLVELRMRAAAELLANSVIGVDRVARACGYGAASHFAKAFRAHDGKAPTEYRALALEGQR